MKEENSTGTERVLLAGVLLVTAFAHIAALGNYLTADAWIFVHPRTFAETFRYFFTSIIPADALAYWLRPLPMFTFWLENLVLPGTLWLPHLTNIAFHVLNVFLLWRLTGLMLAPDGKRTASVNFASVVACLVYGIHPLTVGAVDWVAARFDVVCVTFGLAALYSWMAWWTLNQKNRRAFRLGMILLLCAILSKEQGVVFLLAAVAFPLARVLPPQAGRRVPWIRITSPLFLIAGYILYRLVTFGGIGGYVTEHNGLSILPPFNYLIAIFFPWPNLIPHWGFIPGFWGAAAGILLLGWFLREAPGKPFPSPKREFFIAAAALLGFSLATTMPHPGLTLDRVTGHAESRFALIPVTATAILAALWAARIRTRQVYHAALAVLLVWGVFAAWRTTVQVQAWHGAGRAAERIVTDAVRLVPTPNPNSILILHNIPRNTPQYAYIFGVGLDYALFAAYGREDFRIIRYPKPEDFQHADPAWDAVLSFDGQTGHLERLTARRVSKEEAEKMRKAREAKEKQAENNTGQQ